MSTNEIVQALLDGRDQRSNISVVVNMEKELPYKIIIRPDSGEEQTFEIDEATMIEVNEALIGQE